MHGFIRYRKVHGELRRQLFEFNQLHCMHSTCIANIELFEAQEMQSSL